jgi:flagellar motility protein MotE (MotC chaperone)
MTARQGTIRRRRRQKGLLTAFGLVFAFSAVMRIGTLDFAFADPAPSVPPVAPAPEIAEAIQPLRAAMVDIQAQRDALGARETALADRERAVAAAQVLVEDRLAELEAAEARLNALIAVSDRAAETDLDLLTRVYETMGPDQAAPLFEQMDPSFAAGFLARMAPAAGAAVMAELTPEFGYAVSVVLATRNAAAPRRNTPETPDADTQN